MAFQCNISALKFSEQERLFLRILFLDCQKSGSLKSARLSSSDLAKKLAINTNHLKAIVRHCETKGGVRVIESIAGRYHSARRYELSQTLFDALKQHYARRRRQGRSMV